MLDLKHVVVLAVPAAAELGQNVAQQRLTVKVFT